MQDTEAPTDPAGRSAVPQAGADRRSGPDTPGTAPPAADDLATLPNLGPASAGWLRAAGMATRDDLARLGAVAAFAQVRRVAPRASLNLLWALEGALTGLPWREVAREHRTSLLLALESHEASLSAHTAAPARRRRNK